MPIYEYVCDRCQRITEVRQRMNDAPLTACPSCEEGRLKRILSLTNVGAQASGLKANTCEQVAEPSCFTCGKAGTGCG